MSSAKVTEMGSSSGCGRRAINPIEVGEGVRDEEDGYDDD